MFAHHQETKQFAFHYLKNDQGTLLEVVPERGGIISQWSVAHKNVFYLDQETLMDSSKNIRGGNPILFPMCGPVADGNYQIDGRTYSMKQHGFARNLPWMVGAVENGQDGATMAISLESSDLTREQYPFDFRVDFIYRLTANELRIDQIYENRR